MKKRVFIFLIIILGAHSLTFSNDFIDDQLDKSIEEFSKKNYDTALEIIDGILLIEPDNSIALMYKKTIEDVISIDEEITEIIEEDLVTPAKEENQKTPVNSSISSNGELTSSKKDPILSISTYIGQDSNDMLIVEGRVKVILGAPVLEVKFQSIPLGDYDITKIDIDTIPVEDIFNYSKYNLDFGIGYRYKPFNNITDKGGYFDLKLGVTNFSRDGNFVVPYLGFDTEAAILSSVGNNILFNNIWLGGSGNIYSFDGVFVNNFKIEAKAGINIGAFKFGAFYSYSNIESFTDDSFDNTIYGIIAGINF